MDINEFSDFFNLHQYVIDLNETKQRLCIATLGLAGEVSELESACAAFESGNAHPEHIKEELGDVLAQSVLVLNLLEGNYSLERWLRIPDILPRQDISPVLYCRVMSATVLRIAEFIKKYCRDLGNVERHRYNSIALLNIVNNNVCYLVSHYGFVYNDILDATVKKNQARLAAGTLQTDNR